MDTRVTNQTITIKTLLNSQYFNTMGKFVNWQLWQLTWQNPDKVGEVECADGKISP
jgi:hypothetical protein